MPLARFEDLYRDADARRPAVPVAVAGGADRTVLEALRQANDRGWVRPIVTGDVAEIERVGIDLAGMDLVEGGASEAVALVRAGQAQLLMKGQIATPELMAAVLEPALGLRTGRVICQIVLMEITRDRRAFLLADTGVTIQPDMGKKADILRSALEVAHALGEPQPRVAIMAATEKTTEAMPETLHAAELERRGRAGEFGSCLVQGPLSFDLAYAADAAGKKHLEGSVTGAADVMLFPNLAAANLTVKAIMYTADCRFGGVLRGTSHPVVFMSRADTPTTRLNSLALALRVLQGPS